MAWYDSAVFYHIYPLGLCGCAHENDGVQGDHFDILEEWAEHANQIGCNAIYIGPLFESGSHGYDTIDYRLVDRRLGSNDDFKAFVKHCHDRNMKVIVDGVFNHVGRDFFAFQDVKQKREASPYCGWFCNLNFWGNNEYNDGFSYDNWGGYNLLVKLNQQNPEVKQYHFDTVAYWVNEWDIDGIRLDAADVLDHDFMRELRQFCNGLKPEFWLMGEVIHGDYSRWANGDMLHSVTNYELHKGLYSGHNDHNYFEIAHTIKRLNGIVGDTRLYTFTDNHDVARIYSKLNKKEHMYPVAILQYTVPGIPSIYYGSEFGIEGNKEHGSDWNLRPALQLEEMDQNSELVQLFTRLGKIKQQFRELTDGDYKELLLTNRQFAFSRTLGESSVITIVNNDDQPAHVEVPLPIAANRAVNLLTMGLEDAPEEKDTQALDEEFRKKRQALKEDIFYIISEYYAQIEAFSGRIQELEQSLEHLSLEEDNTKDILEKPLETMKKDLAIMQDTYERLCQYCGKKPDSTPKADMTNMDHLIIENGRLIADIAPNNGVVAYVTNE